VLEQHTGLFLSARLQPCYECDSIHKRQFFATFSTDLDAEEQRIERESARSYRKASSSPAGLYPASILTGASSTSNQWVVPMGMCTTSPSARVNVR
jgi:hypothetical protein